MSAPRRRKIVGQRIKVRNDDKEDKTAAMEEWIGNLFGKKDFSSEY